MEKTLIIEGNRPVEILDGLRDIGILDEYSHLDTDNTKFEVKFKTQTPQFKVGDRVECIREISGFKVGMVYKIINETEDFFRMINNNGERDGIPKENMYKFFKPYEKPKEGDEYWVIDGTDDIVNSEWGDFAAENAIWNLGLAFHTKEQCEFARERLSKLF